MIAPEAMALYKRYGVLSEREAASRYEVYRHAWETTVAMEGGCALDLARTFIMPAALRLEADLAASVRRARDMGRGDEARVRQYTRAADLVDRLYGAMEGMEAALPRGPADVVRHMAVLRSIVDALEAITPDSYWPFPCYGEMFFNFSN